MKYLYDVYSICEEKDCPDLTIALAMFRAEHPDCIDHETDKAMRLFIGRNGEDLAAAFKAHNRAAFDTVVERLIAMEQAEQ